MSDAYATWKPELATDLADGLPDLAMVPLIEDLRKAGFITFQSCFGHPGKEDGTLWIKEPPLNSYHPDAFTRIQMVLHGPEGHYWEWWWWPDQGTEALAEIRNAYLGDR